MPDGQNPMMQALMGMAQQQGAPPGGSPPGGPPPSGVPPTAGPQGPPSAAGQGNPDPKELIVNGLIALQFGMSALGGDETMGKVRQLVQKFVERMQKASPQGRAAGAAAGAVPPPTPPGVGGMPGTPQA